MSTVLTFLISALLHELVMGCITKKLRGYGFFAMMLQMPIVAIQRTSLVKGRTLFNVSWMVHFLSSIADYDLECLLLDIDDPGLINRESD